MTPANFHFLIASSFLLLLILGILASAATVIIAAHKYECFKQHKITSENIIKDWVAEGRKEEDYHEGGPSPFL